MKIKDIEKLHSEANSNTDELAYLCKEFFEENEKLRAAARKVIDEYSGLLQDIKNSSNDNRRAENWVFEMVDFKSETLEQLEDLL